MSSRKHLKSAPLLAAQSINAVMRFSLNSLRGRMSQAIPVTLALLLLIGTTQAIAALHTVSSTITRQQIAAHWRGPADLLVRSQASVSQPERNAGWINPASALDTYGGINEQQLASIASLSQVAQILPFATVGWRRIDIITPVVLQQKGFYRITAHWTGVPPWAGNTLAYVEVTDLTSLTTEESLTQPLVQHLILPANAPSVIYPMSVPATQMLVGVSSDQAPEVQSLLIQADQPIAPVHPTIKVDKLNGQLTVLSTCAVQSAPSICWRAVPTQTGHISYQAQGLQLLRYSQAQYSATSQQLSSGQLTINAFGQDTQSPVYRVLLQQHLMLPDGNTTSLAVDTGQQEAVLPLTAPLYMPVLPRALQLLPLAQACLVNGKQCYSGLYVRLRGVDRYNSQSLSLVQATAATITARTGLYVDILDGSSTRTIAIIANNHAGHTLTATWPVVGVAVQITHGVDALQNTLFLFCLFTCLLALASAGVLIGIGRRNEARIIEQLGWPLSLRICVYISSALLLALPGCLFSSALIVLSTRFWPGNLSLRFFWALLAIGAIVFTISLTYPACRTPVSRRVEIKRIGSAQHIRTLLAGVRPIISIHWLHTIKSSRAFHIRVIAPLVCGFAITAAIFLIAIEYLMLNNLNRELVVTVLGSQVHVALEGTQLLLLLLFTGSALLTTGLCTSLLLHGRRDELSLLAKVGWERQHVLIRLLKESWLTAALSGAMGALLALGVIIFAGQLPPLWVIASVLSTGPMLGIVLMSLVASILAWRELHRVYLKRVS